MAVGSCSPVQPWHSTASPSCKYSLRWNPCGYSRPAPWNTADSYWHDLLLLAPLGEGTFCRRLHRTRSYVTKHAFTRTNAAGPQTAWKLILQSPIKKARHSFKIFFWPTGLKAPSSFAAALVLLPRYSANGSHGSCFSTCYFGRRKSLQTNCFSTSFSQQDTSCNTRPATCSLWSL